MLLLVILSLLILFVMIAVTYVLVAARHLQTSRSYARVNQTGDPPAKILDGAIEQVLVGSTNTHSVIYPHSLLEDFYGGPSGQPVLWAKVGTAPNKLPATAPGQILEFEAQKAPANSTIMPNINDTPSVIEGYYEGCVLTMTSGPAVGISTRIVRHMYDATSNKVTLRVMPFKTNSGNVVPNVNDVFIINGRSFSGTGFGFNPDQSAGKTQTVDAKDDHTVTMFPFDREFALMPNPVFYQPSGNYKAAAGQLRPVPFGGWGGANEDYDAPDYQNIQMSWIDTNGKVWLPSYHRPDLINYWYNRMRQADVAAVPPYPGNPSWKWTDAGSQDLLRKVMLRPMGPMTINGVNMSGAAQVDHPNFTGGGGASFDPINGPWDIDNDGDGVPDSVWLDLGYPVQSTIDGRLYKPLFAILCVDLDGRINVNAHGTTEQISTVSVPPLGGWTSQFMHTDQLTGPFAGTNGTTPYSFVRGDGYGPAEINLVATGLNVSEVNQLLRGGPVGTQIFDGRYGEYGHATPAQAGMTMDPQTYAADTNNSLNPLALIKRFQLPDEKYMVQCSYKSPFDLWGSMSVGIDYNGQPYYSKPIREKATTNYTDGRWGEAVHSPYDINLSREARNPARAAGAKTADNPFTVFDLERMLRQYDIDSNELPDRLWKLSGASGTPTRGRWMTTDGWDTPGPNSMYPESARKPVLNITGLTYGERYSSHHITEWLSAVLQTNGLGVKKANDNIRTLLSPDLIAGLRMDINRPLGDGRDGNGNNIVDEPIDTELATKGSTDANFTWSSAFAAANKPFTLNLTNGLNVTGPSSSDKKLHVTQTDELMARQLLARHLYVLARLMIDDKFLASADNHWFDNDPDTNIKSDTAPYGKKYVASVQRIAQWAVNVVDFMDSDSIMTPFEYDLYPFSITYPPSTTETDKTKWPPKTQVDPQQARTWCVDGIVDDGTGSVSPDDDEKTHPWRGLAWGCERPELLITETFAFHDRQTEDLDTEHPDDTEADNHKAKYTDDMKDPDASFDQKLMPRSGFFVELYNPWANNGSSRPAEFYSNISDAAPGGVRLDRPSGGAKQSPVWRMVVIASDKDPDDPNTKAADKQIDRSIYFGNIGDVTKFTLPQTGEDGKRYFADVANQLPLIKPGRYAVIGSSGVIGSAASDVPANGSYEICLGRKKGATPGSRASMGIDDTRRIVLTPANNPDTPQVQVLKNANPGNMKDPVSADVQPAVAVVINKFMNSAGAPELHSLSITEPKPGYPKYTGAGGPMPGPGGTMWVAPTGQYDDGHYEPALDIPLDQQVAIQRDTELQKNGFKDDYRRVHLQRLANPLLPYDKYRNPYLTIDSMSVPLTKFNGIDDKGHGASPEPVAGTNPDKILTYERGDENPPPSVKRNLWHYDFTAIHDNSANTTKTDGTTNAMNRQLQHSLGHLNNPYAPAFKSTSAPPSTNDQGGQKFYAGSPDSNGAPPFPWLVWNNRPYANVSEIMLVPASSSSRLAREASTLTNSNPYKVINNTQPVTFSHLMNFFHSDSDSTKATNLANILEYLRVPSRYVGTETVLNPKAFEWNCDTASGYLAGETAGGQEPNGTAGLHPPFNMVSNYREPGRVNINTMPTGKDATNEIVSPVWNGLLGGDPATSPLYGQTVDHIVKSRQGYAAQAYNFDNTGKWPSIFSNPFRSPAGADMVPRPELAHKPVNVTLWRADGPNPDGSSTPLLAGSPPQAAYNDRTRNSYFYSQPFDRLASKLTTHSNVYAVWITVGYFEVSPWTNSSGVTGADIAHPDGYQLGQELGADTGEIERHRGFYIIDRSIPVGFQRGQDLNSNETVLLKRFIE